MELPGRLKFVEILSWEKCHEGGMSRTSPEPEDLLCEVRVTFVNHEAS